MLGAVIKTYFSEKEGVKPENIYSVSIMPCTAKKFEAQRTSMTRKGLTDVDAVLTTRELVHLIKMYGIQIEQLEPEGRFTRWRRSRPENFSGLPAGLWRLRSGQLILS